MYKENRKFAIPYNNTKFEEYYGVIKPYLKNIDSIYFGMPWIIDNNNDKLNDPYLGLTDEQNTFDFLEKSKDHFGCGIKRLLVINKVFYDMREVDMTYWVFKNLMPMMQYYCLDGVIVSNYSFARIIRTLCPDLEIQTSCNSFHYTLENFKRWKETLNVSTFNPPRDILRHPRQLKEIHEAGYRIKCLVNEMCIVGCPQYCSHFVSVAAGVSSGENYCKNCKFVDILKCGFILPTWYDYYDEYVDVYKISGRLANNQRLKMILDAYIGCKEDVDLFDIVVGEPLYRIQRLSNKSLMIKNISRKLIDCEQKNCKECGVCEAIIRKYLKNSGINIDSRVENMIV